MNTTRRRRPAHITCALVLAAAALPAGAFETSCNPAVAADFDHAVTLLHSFEYPETTRLFAAILARDPDCAMARWGIAMSTWHPLWAPPTPAELRDGAAVLSRLGDRPPSPREAAWIGAISAFFSSDDPLTHQLRARAYEERMREIYDAWPDDADAATFYALALLATADPTDKSYAHQYHAAALLNGVREANPAHPGALHYLIHSYDYPGLARLALGAATVYASAAPDSAHAQHMPSHIFTRLGLWERSIASNLDSTASATEFTERAHLRGHYDEGLHSIDYLMYALLQLARDDEARRLLDRLGTIDRAHVDSFKAAYTYAATPARYALERRDWQAAGRLELAPAAFPWHEFPWAASMHHFARGIGAARAGELDAARREIDAIRALEAALGAATLPYWREEVYVQEAAVSAWLALAEGRRDDALALAASAADREDAVDKHPVTPGEVLPARELYADLLAALGEHAAALAQYERVLRSAPNRLNALAGAAAAAAGAGDTGTARRYYAELVAMTGTAASPRATLETAQAYLVAHPAAAGDGGR